MNKIKLLCFFLVVVCGVFLFFFGGYDDSPGAQGLGLLIVAVGIIKIVKSKKKASARA